MFGMDDMTYCKADCRAKEDCYRNPKNIRNPQEPHSYADFSEVCKAYVPREAVTKTIFQLIEAHVNGEDMPERVRYPMMEDGFEYFKWDKDDEEYRCETDRDCYLSQVPWHHLLDDVEIIGG